MSDSVKDMKEFLSKIVTTGSLIPDFKVIATLKYLSIDEVDESVLEALTREGLLVRRITDVAIACSKCGSLSISTKYVCPACSSVSIVKSRLIQHIDCGYVGSEVSFLRSNSGALKCPKCGREVAEERLIVYATFFECLSCHFRTSSPNVIHKCHNCENIFKPADASLRPIYLYELSDKGRELLKQ